MIYNVDHITFSYPSSRASVLDDVSMNLEEGRILCILGPNGAGKTTLLSCMVGLLRPQSGRILLCDEDISSLSEKQIASKVAYVPQMHTPAFDYTVFDFVLMGTAASSGMFGRPKNEDEQRCFEVLKKVGIDHLAQKSYQKISGGERQQALIARAIMQDPGVILFDEPTAHLDYGNQQKVLRQIRDMAEDGFSIIITTHNPDHALLLDDQAAIVGRDGNLIQGDSRDILTENRLKEIYGIDLKMIYVEELGRMACLTPQI